MQLSEIEREQLYAIVEKYDHHPDVQRMREYIQHGSVTTYQHCKNVALVSFWLNRRLHLHADETSLAVGDVASRVGYGSQSAFAAAMLREFGASPRALRREPDDN